MLGLRDLGVRAALACPAREAVCLRLQFADASFSPIDILASCRTPERSRARANVKHGPGLQMGIVAQSSPCGYPPTHVCLLLSLIYSQESRSHKPILSYSRALHRKS